MASTRPSVRSLPIQLPTGWQDYQLLEGGQGMKMERWGRHTLVRPDPQIIWPRRGGATRWEDWDGIYHRSEKGGGEWEFKRSLPESWEVKYRELTFKIRPTNFKHTGLFPEQAVNWDWCSDLIRRRKKTGREVSVLNLFGYTGAASVAAAAAGAQVCHVDAAKGMVDWCRDNASLSGLSGAPIRYIVDDCLKFVRREVKRGRRYDGLIMDPPSYGRGAAGEMWKLEDHIWELLNDCRQILTDTPLFFLLNTYTTGLSPTVVSNLLVDVLDGLGGTISTGEVGLPFQRDGKILPCGMFGRWAEGE
jgi:23S rRNA (cytosine1962-C5)-methyltransferase